MSSRPSWCTVSVARPCASAPLLNERIWKSSFEALARLGLPLDWTSLLYAMIAGTISILITLALRRRGWVLKV